MRPVIWRGNATRQGGGMGAAHCSLLLDGLAEANIEMAKLMFQAAQ